MDLTFFAANVPKVAHDGWFPPIVALLIFAVLKTWQQGREVVSRNRRELEGPLQAFVEEVRRRDKVYRAPRTTIYMNVNRDTAPPRCARISSTTTSCTRAW